MMPAANQGVGMNMGMPDVCTTPAAPAPIPIPYPNIGMNAMAMPFIPNILVSMAPAQNMGAKPLLTNGDNAGVAHPLFMQPGGTLMGNPRILMGGMPASHLMVPTYGNNFNNPVGAKTVPSVTNVLLGSCAARQDHRSAARQLHIEAGVARVLPGGVATMRLPCISLSTDAWLHEQLCRLAQVGATGIAIDLRGNPGGAVHVAHRLADTLTATNMPLAIATDSRTASAAELLAARLQDTPQARVFGETTYGKGTAMMFWCGRDWLLPTGQTIPMLRQDGRPIQLQGVAPDVQCTDTTAMQQAIRWLRMRTRNRTR